MKIAYFGNFSDQKYEGLITILSKLKKHFSLKNQLFINDPALLEDADIVNIHSSGFFECIKYYKAIKYK